MAQHSITPSARIFLPKITKKAIAEEFGKRNEKKKLLINTSKWFIISGKCTQQQKIQLDSELHSMFLRWRPRQGLAQRDIEITAEDIAEKFTINKKLWH